MDFLLTVGPRSSGSEQEFVTTLIFAGFPLIGLVAPQASEGRGSSHLQSFRASDHLLSRHSPREICSPSTVPSGWRRGPQKGKPANTSPATGPLHGDLNGPSMVPSGIVGTAEDKQLPSHQRLRFAQRSSAFSPRPASRSPRSDRGSAGSLTQYLNEGKMGLASTNCWWSATRTD